MRKRVYRAESIKQVNVEKLRELVFGERIIFGVDVAKEDFVGAFMNDRQEVLKTIKWKSPKETRRLVALLEMLRSASLEIAMEPTGTYGDTLRVLVEEAGFPVYLVSPKRSRDACEVYDGVPSSHDAKSAAIVAKLHLDKASKPWREKSNSERGLAAAVETMELYRGQLGRNVNRLEAKLARYWPELPRILDLDSATLLGLLERYGGPSGVIEAPDSALEVMREAGGSMLSIEKCKAVIASARSTIGVPMTVAEQEGVKILACETNRNRRAAKQARTKVEQLAVKNKKISSMARAVGKATASVFAVELGYTDNYHCAAAYQKAAGLNLKERSSGQHKGQLKITKRGSGEVRRYLFMAALRLIQQDEVCLAWYKKKVARDGGRYKGKAIIALMRKLIKALWHVGNGSEFDSRKLFDINRLDLAA